MARILVIVFLLTVLAGCNSSSGINATKSAAPDALEVSPTPVTNAQGDLQPTQDPVAKSPALSSPSPTVDKTQVLTQTNGSLVVEIFSASDTEVNSDTYTITGTAPVGTVVSANDQITVVDQSQTFSIDVPLEDGPNLIDVVASDWSGNEVSFIITVTYFA